MLHVCLCYGCVHTGSFVGTRKKKSISIIFLGSVMYCTHREYVFIENEANIVSLPHLFTIFLMNILQKFSKFEKRTKLN